MENTDLNIMWQNAQLQNKGRNIDDANIVEMMKRNHCKTISKVLSDIKMRVLLYSLMLSVYIGLMIYAFIYLGINFKAGSIASFSLVGLFLLTSTTIEINRLIVFTRNADNLPVKESQNYFRKKLNRVKTIDFFSYLFVLYLSAILVIRGYIQDIGGLKNLSFKNEFQPLIMVFILILIITPWFLKYQNNQRYRKIASDLDDTTEKSND
jgi:hypothetical protein